MSSLKIPLFLFKVVISFWENRLKKCFKKREKASLKYFREIDTGCSPDEKEKLHTDHDNCFVDSAELDQDDLVKQYMEHAPTSSTSQPVSPGTAGQLVKIVKHFSQANSTWNFFSDSSSSSAFPYLQPIMRKQDDRSYVVITLNDYNCSFLIAHGYKANIAKAHLAALSV